MPDEVIALFPLGTVLSPGRQLPLHVFEPRYRRLIADVTQGPGSGRFGVVALIRGLEVRVRGLADAPETAAVGTVAEIVQINRREDGAYDLLAVGSRRFRIRRTIVDGPYPRAHIDYLPEPDGELSTAHVAAVSGLIERYAQLLATLGGRPSGMDGTADAWRLSYQVAAAVPLSVAEQQSLLAAPSTAARLQRGAALLRRELALLRHTRSVAAPLATVRLGGRPN